MKNGPSQVLPVLRRKKRDTKEEHLAELERRKKCKLDEFMSPKRLELKINNNNSEAIPILQFLPLLIMSIIPEHEEMKAENIDSGEEDISCETEESPPSKRNLT